MTIDTVTYESAFGLQVVVETRTYTDALTCPSCGSEEGLPFIVVPVGESAYIGSTGHCVNCSHQVFIGSCGVDWAGEETLINWYRDGNAWACQTCESLFVRPCHHDCGSAPEDNNHAAWLGAGLAECEHCGSLLAAKSLLNASGNTYDNAPAVERDDDFIGCPICGYAVTWFGVAP